MLNVHYPHQGGLIYIEIDSLYEGIDFHTSNTRAQFEELCSDLFCSVMEHIEKAIKGEVIEATDNNNMKRKLKMQGIQ